MNTGRVAYRARRLERSPESVAALLFRLPQATAFSDDSRLVERPYPGAAPTAFRIWHAGPNDSDGGPDIFSRESAELLMSEQETRGNLYSFDFDHLSLNPNRPAEAGRAAGWHRLAVRDDENGEPELWATEIQWCEDVRADIEATPPRRRYFSPAFNVNSDTGEIVSYTNTAVCINPATWNNTQLATRTRTAAMKMSKAEREKLATLCAMHAVRSNAEAKSEDRAAAEAMYSMHGGEEEHKRLQSMAEAEDAPESKEPESKEPESSEREPSPPTSRSPGSEDAKAKAAKAESEKAEKEAKEKAAKAEAERQRTRAKDPSTDAIAELTGRITDLEKREREHQEARRRARVDALLAERKDLSRATRDSLRTLRPSQVKTVLDTLPRQNGVTPPTPTGGTRGAEQGTAGTSSSTPSVDAEVDRAMRLREPPGPVLGFGKPVLGRRVFHTRAPSEHRAQLAAREAEKSRADAAAALIASTKGKVA